jgi:hypothetical protein
MLCETCRWTERPGFIPRPSMSAARQVRDEPDFIPCPDCGGQTVAHCCEGLCEQPEPDNPEQGG